jgi:hypothetical protein
MGLPFATSSYQGRRSFQPQTRSTNCDVTRNGIHSESEDCWEVVMIIAPILVEKTCEEWNQSAPTPVTFLCFVAWMDLGRCIPGKAVSTYCYAIKRPAGQALRPGPEAAIPLYQMGKPIRLCWISRFRPACRRARRPTHLAEWNVCSIPPSPDSLGAQEE